jgi:hypothetical protein
VMADGKGVGTISTLGIVGGRTMGLAKVRREVQDGAIVIAGGAPAVVTALPFTGW